MYATLEALIRQNKDKPVILYDLLEARIEEYKHLDILWRLLAARI
jgi:hypothetical protein